MEDPVLKFCDGCLDRHLSKEVSRYSKSVSQSFLSFWINIKSLFHILLFFKGEISALSLINALFRISPLP